MIRFEAVELKHVFCQQARRAKRGTEWIHDSNPYHTSITSLDWLADIVTVSVPILFRCKSWRSGEMYILNKCEDSLGLQIPTRSILFSQYKRVKILR